MRLTIGALILLLPLCSTARAADDDGPHLVPYGGADACDGFCATGMLSTCTCGIADPCGWGGDGLCDSLCADVVTPHFDDRNDCGGSGEGEGEGEPGEGEGEPSEGEGEGEPSEGEGEGEGEGEPSEGEGEGEGESGEGEGEGESGGEGEGEDVDDNDVRGRQRVADAPAGCTGCSALPADGAVLVATLMALLRRRRA